MEEFFRGYGKIASVWIARNPPGFGFVTFEDPRDAADAVKELNGKDLRGRAMAVEVSGARKGGGGRSDRRDDAGGSYGGGRSRSPPPASRGPRPGPPDLKGLTSVRVEGLPFRFSRDELTSHFDRFGKIADVYLPRDRNTGEGRGFGFVRYSDSRDAEDAVEAMDRREIAGRPVTVFIETAGRRGENGDRRPPADDRGRGRGGGSYGNHRDRRSRSRSRSPRRRSRSRSRSRGGRY